MAYVSKLQIASGTYDIKDAEARASITGNEQAITSNSEKIANNLGCRISSDRNFLIVSDSYGAEDNGTLKKWPYCCRVHLGVAEDHWHNMSVSGAAFYDGTFLNQITNATALALKDSITDILVIGGLNDSITNLNNDAAKMTALITSIESFINFAKTNYTNAQIWMGYAGEALDNSPIIDGRIIDNRIRAEFLYNIYAIKNGCKVIPGLKDSWSMVKSLFYTGDYVHPSFDTTGALYDGYGCDYLGKSVANAILGLEFPSIYPVHEQGMSPLNGLALSFTNKTSYKNDTYFIQFLYNGDPSFPNFTKTGGLTINNNSDIALLQLGEMYFNRLVSKPCSLMIMDTSGNLHVLNGMVVLSGDIIYFRYFDYNGSSGVSYTVSSLWILTDTLQFNKADIN